MTILLLTVHLILWTILIGNLAYLRRGRNIAGGCLGCEKVSILVPARNEADNLVDLIPSVLAQSYESFELIIYDDQSSDGSDEVVARHLVDERVVYVRGSGPPAGWVGKVAALYAATRHATGNLYVFMDADSRFRHPGALSRLVALFESAPPDSALTALPSHGGKGQLLVSLVPFTTLAALPWFLVRRVQSRLISALNGQLWMIRRQTYHQLEPHRHVFDRVLEDVHIGRYLKESGVYPRLVDLSGDLAVRMYGSFPEAWQGFQKNAYLLMGGSPLFFFAYLILFAASTWLSPFVSIYFLVSAWAIKVVCDRSTDIHPAVSLGAPLSFMLATFLQLDSAIAHWRGTVRWKGRNVAGD